MKKTLLTLCITALLFSSCNETTTEKGPDPNQEFDVVILNGRVMDPETNFDGIRNVGVKDGKIAIITEAEIAGKETINAEGHVVAPGFIDTHQHATDQFSRKVNLRDGLTTQMDFEAGAGISRNGMQRPRVKPRPTTVWSCLQRLPGQRCWTVRT